MFKTVWLLVLFSVMECSFAQSPPQTDFKKLTLEELLDINVTSVARKPEPLAQTAAAISVITSDDIRRTGVTSIAEALRLVPGMQVARINASNWAISVRGFSSVLSDKMLVLIDGRTVYSPIFAGVFWELQDLVLDDIDRIEVVRGPGATLWSNTNAVNGIVNIITKSAHQTQSVSMNATGGGAETLAVTSLRVGHAYNADTSYRFYGKYSYQDQLVLLDGTAAQDSSRFGRVGFRIDSSRGPNEITLQGDSYRGYEGVFGFPDAKMLGGDAFGRWNRQIANDSSIQLQISYQRLLRRVQPNTDIRQRILDIDWQHQLKLASNNLTWGAAYRWNDDATFPTPALNFDPDRRTYPLVTAFIQDEIPLLQNRLKLQVGSKFEHNDFSGFEIQPSVRASWQVRPDKFLWGAVSRAVRTPTRFDQDSSVNVLGLTLVGNKNFEPENLVAFETGYRSKLTQRISADVATFFNVYDNLRTGEVVGFRPPQARFFNNLDEKTYGVEFSGNYDALESLRFRTGYWYLGKRLRMEPGHVDFFGNNIEGNDPKHQFFIRASADLPKRVELDSTLRFVSSLPNPPVPRYFELDTRVGWNPTPSVELSVIGRNLLHARHLEFDQPNPVTEQVQRDVYGRIAVRF
jgi:iron complex outermembrane recepter protein